MGVVREAGVTHGKAPCRVRRNGGANHGRPPGRGADGARLGRCGWTELPSALPMRSRDPERLETPTLTSGEPASRTGVSIAERACACATRAASWSVWLAQSRCPARWPAISTWTHGAGGVPPTLTGAVVEGGSGSTRTSAGANSSNSRGWGLSCAKAVVADVSEAAANRIPVATLRATRPRPGEGVKPGGAVSADRSRRDCRSQAARSRSVDIDMGQNRVMMSMKPRSTLNGASAISSADSQRRPMMVLGAIA